MVQNWNSNLSFSQLYLLLYIYRYREMICPQYFYNIFTGCYYWGKKIILVLSSNLNQ